MSAYFAMGGYGGYIWPAYAVTAAVLLIVWFSSVRTLRAREMDIETAEAASPRRERARK
jgi:heme exporter protein D